MNNRNKGFTLIELLVIIVIIGVGMSIAVPSFQGMIVRNRIIAQANEVILAVNLARGEASRTGGQVSIVPTAPTATNEFGNGFCVVRGNAPPATCGAAANGDIVRIFEAFLGESTLNSVDDSDLIEFNPLGGLANAAGHDLDLCHPDFPGRRIRINLIGRVKSHMEDVDGDFDPAPLAENQPCSCANPSPHC